MVSAWYIILSFTLITYIVLDGRNFGIGVLHWTVAKVPTERRQVIAVIGPLWSWHEVWLVSFGGILFVAFPRLLASAFSGYYLALFLILWCLILRGISLEVGGHINDRLWQSFWDFVFLVSNTLLAILFGAAAGNLVRGVPIDADGNFHMAFFTDFGVRGHVGILDWYTVSISLFAVVILAAHGATYLMYRTEGVVHDRSAISTQRLWVVTIPLFLIISIETWYVRPELAENLVSNHLSWLGIVGIVTSIIILFTGIRYRRERRAVLGSTFLIAALLATGAAIIFPTMETSTLSPAYSLTAHELASNHESLVTAIIWWPFALLLSIIYFVVIARHYSGKVSAPKDSQGFY